MICIRLLSRSDRKMTPEEQLHLSYVLERLNTLTLKGDLIIDMENKLILTEEDDFYMVLTLPEVVLPFTAPFNHPNRRPMLNGYGVKSIDPVTAWVLKTGKRKEIYN